MAEASGSVCSMDKGAPAAFPPAQFPCALSCVCSSHPEIGTKSPGNPCQGCCDLSVGFIPGIIIAEVTSSSFSCSPLWLAGGFQSAQTNSSKCLCRRILRRGFNKMDFSPRFHDFHDLRLCREVLGWFWQNWSFLWGLDSRGCHVPGKGSERAFLGFSFLA